jgi:hypothetical protein
VRYKRSAPLGVTNDGLRRVMSGLWIFVCRKTGEIRHSGLLANTVVQYFHTGGVAGSIPAAPTIYSNT